MGVAPKEDTHDINRNNQFTIGTFNDGIDETTTATATFNQPEEDCRRNEIYRLWNAKSAMGRRGEGMIASA